MRHAKQVEILEELMGQLDAGTTHDAGAQYRMQTDAYVCPDIAKQEWEALFHNQPQLIGMSGDLPKSGSYFTFDELGTPIVATRDKQGKFHAFVNACRHRGARVATQERGNTPMLVCPFHKWSYTTDGKLAGVPEMEQFGEFDKSCHSLIKLPAEEKFGMLWVHLREDGELDVADWLGPLADELSGFDFGSLQNTGRKTIEKALNWKLANDTFGETYHFAKLHSNTLAQTYYGGNLHYEEFGRHHRFVTAGRRIDELRKLPSSDWELAENVILLYYIFPNIQLIVGKERANLTRIYPDPINPGRSKTIIDGYFSQEMVDAAAAVPREERIEVEDIYDPNRTGSVFTPEAIFEVFTSTVEAEDYEMGAQQQIAAASGKVKESIFGRNEAPLHHFHNNFREILGMPPLEKVG